jgi:hypothetical protein
MPAPGADSVIQSPKLEKLARESLLSVAATATAWVHAAGY